MTDPGQETPRVLPPGQRLAESPRVQHYGPVPKFKPDRWRLTISGATFDGQDHHIDHDTLSAMDQVRVVGDMHCVTRWTVLSNIWEGVAARTILDLVPPVDDCVAVMAWAEYGYSTNIRMEDFASPRAVLATRRNGTQLTPEHGWPLRLIVPHLYAWKGPKWLRGIEYLRFPQRGFWEERGYHAVGDPWREERYSYQE